MVSVALAADIPCGAVGLVVPMPLRLVAWSFFVLAGRDTTIPGPWVLVPAAALHYRYERN